MTELVRLPKAQCEDMVAAMLRASAKRLALLQRQLGVEQRSPEQNLQDMCPEREKD